MITINNYTDEDIAQCYDFINQPGAKYGIFGLEVGEQGTPHIQGYVYFHTVKSVLQVSMLFPRAHIIRANGTAQENRIYCSKGQQPKAEFDELGELGPNYGKDADVYEVGEIPLDDKTKGLKGSELFRMQWKLAKEGRFEELNPIHYEKFKRIHNQFRKVESRPELCDLWICGPSGCGKSRPFREDPECFCKDANIWWDMYNDEPKVCIEDFDIAVLRKDPTMARLFKLWTDHYPINAEVKGGYMKIRPKQIIVTSNWTLAEVFRDLDEPDFAALARRFTVKVWNPFDKVFNEVDARYIP